MMTRKLRQTTICYDHVMLRPAEQIGLHQQETWELSYIIKGSGERILGGTRERFREGDLVLVVPETPHQWIFDEGGGGNIENIAVMFPGDFLKRMADAFPEYRDMAQWYGTLAASIRATGQDCRETGMSLLRMEHEQPHERINTLLQILSSIYGSRHFIVAGTHASHDKAQEKTDKITTYLRCNFLHEVSIDALARHAGMSRSALCTFFKKHTGETIFQHLISLRIECAKNLLRTTDMPISKCCCNSGFNDVPHFDRMFKRETGMSPKEYRDSGSAMKAPDIGP